MNRAEFLRRSLPCRLKMWYLTATIYGWTGSRYGRLNVPRWGWRLAEAERVFRVLGGMV
jgi:hypothetical protein